jgi:2'-5' RNA ligase
VRLFVAVWPDDETCERLAELSVALGQPDGWRLVVAGSWHVTLRFLGEVVDDLVPRLADGVAGAVRSVGGPVRCEVGPATAWFSGGRVLQLPVSGLDDLAHRVRAATLPVVPEGRPERFEGHLTLGRAKGRGLARVARDALAGLCFSASFVVAQVDLVSSELTAAGPRYATVARAELAGP